KAVGYSHQAQAYHVHAGNWHRIDRALFRLPEWIPGPHDELIRRTLWSGKRAVVSHETALAVHEIGELESPRVHLTVPPSFRRRDPALVLHHQALPPDDIVEHPGYRVTTVARSLIDVAPGIDEDQLARAIAEAREAGLLSIRALRDRAEAVDLRAALRIHEALARMTSAP
ncbi:MAG TPA: hypothetical protein VK506_13210, partial [Conexibacter sp.]|nr:hypothetical protein [Conexibacter sp.]